MADKKLKVAVIGVGGISSVHIKGYLALPDQVELYALCDINPKTLKAKGEKYGITRLYDDHKKMLAELPEIDIVSVCTWNSAHAVCTIDALNAGKHVICEKPMAMNVEQAVAMKEAADRNGKLLMIGFVRRFGNDCAIAKDFIDNGKLGDIYYAKASYLRRNGAPGGWFGDIARSGGGPMIDLGVHVIDLVRYLMGRPQPVSVYGATFNKLGDFSNIKGKTGAYKSETTGEHVFNVEDLACALIRFDNGAVLNIDASFTLHTQTPVDGVELFGTKAGVRIGSELKIATEANGYLVDQNFDVKTGLDFAGLFENEIRHFVECVTKGIPCRAPAEDGVVLMKILCAVYESARTGRDVTIA
ncbi:MAG: Gfo/Idh/MocA family oxidoreductase [Clostridia bacterium]|nr:Gfo/Idh/MocA family oxidoreductase [Clostridia bacterium]